MVLGLEYEVHSRNSRGLCELVMRVTNKGRRPLNMAVARFAILKGLASEASRPVEFPEYLNASAEELSQLQIDKKLVWREPLPQLTAKGTRVAPEEELTEVRAIHLDKPGVYQVIFVVNHFHSNDRSISFRNSNGYHAFSTALL